MCWITREQKDIFSKSQRLLSKLDAGNIFLLQLDSSRKPQNGDKIFISV